MSANSERELQRIYSDRFLPNLSYRKKVWRVLVATFFQKYIGRDDVVLDLGCGYGEFINAVHCHSRLAMDLNPDAPKHLDPSVHFLEQDCSEPWEIEAGSLDLVFTSNFFEHLPNKAALGRTLAEAFRCLAPGGRLFAMGPNIRFLPGSYWDFWDHHLALSDKSLSEGLVGKGFEIVSCRSRFLPYTMVGQREYPGSFLKLYLACPFVWPLLGKQFLVIARKPS